MDKRGVVIGKFYPPHKGHHYLINTARANAEQVTVIVCRRPEEQPSADLRASWLREVHPDVEVIVVDDIHPADDSRAWAEYTIQILGYQPDVVFTSEDYGDAYACYLGCKHVLVDKARQVVPCSGTAVRNNPLACWDFLEPCVRAYYVKRVCVVGAESTGTTTMAQALAEHYQTVWVPEYGRDYWVEKMERGEEKWQTAEFVHIALEQSRREDEAAREANRLLICDTDAFATSIWHRRYIGCASPEVEAIGASRHYDLYLLTDVDIPFVQDGTRDGEHLRQWMHDVFEAELKAQKKRYTLLSGSHQTRLQKAIELINPLLKGPYYGY
jgi:NadR type nicotinamide-nucleotide adenylyltransferase